MTEGLHSQLPFCAPVGHTKTARSWSRCGDRHVCTIVLCRSIVVRLPCQTRLPQPRTATGNEAAKTSCGENITRRNARRRFKSGGELNRRPFARRPISSGYFVGGDFKIGELRCSRTQSTHAGQNRKLTPKKALRIKTKRSAEVPVIVFSTLTVLPISKITILRRFCL